MSELSDKITVDKKPGEKPRDRPSERYIIFRRGQYVLVNKQQYLIERQRKRETDKIAKKPAYVP